jgi:formylglycine-generating enzyme required for sulfatase activity
LREELKKSKSKVLLPRHWEDKSFGKANPNNPVVGISLYEANAYCEWLFQNWNALPESKANTSLKPQSIRLTLETEWQKAAGGIIPQGRYAWDEKGKESTSLKEILRHANVGESGIGKTTPVNAYPLGKSPYGVMDMSGNVWEWQANYSSDKKLYLGLRGGSWGNIEDYARAAIRVNDDPRSGYGGIGFRTVAVPLPND